MVAVVPLAGAQDLRLREHGCIEALPKSWEDRKHQAKILDTNSVAGWVRRDVGRIKQLGRTEDKIRHEENKAAVIGGMMEEKVAAKDKEKQINDKYEQIQAQAKEAEATHAGCHHYPCTMVAADQAAAQPFQ